MQALPVLLIIALFINPFITSAQNLHPGSYPYIILSNKQVSCSIFLPHADDGFYRSTRWEWSGIIWQLIYNGHTFFTERTTCTPHNPLDNEHGMSTAEEFGIDKAVRYDEAAPGETFIKIGVGLLEKPKDESQYQFNGQYKLVNPGTWNIQYGDTWVEFEHILNDNYGYSYRYQKSMKLVTGEPVLLISNSLENTGTRRIATDQYNHNFFAIDDIHIGPNYHLEFSFPATLINDLSEFANITNNVFRFKKDVNTSLFTGITGFENTPEDTHVVLTNTLNNAGVDIRGDYPMSRFNLWTDGQVLCPEMYINIEIEPGKTVSWSRTYTFFTE